MSTELVLHLELNGFEVIDKEEIVKDVSRKHHVGTVHGRVDIVADDTFGACASFDGNASNHISIPSDNSLKNSGDVTVEAWVYVSQEASGYFRVVGRGGYPQDYSLWCVQGGGWLFQRYASIPPGSPPPPTASAAEWLNWTMNPQVVNASCQMDSPTRALNTWYHLAGVIEGTKGSLYLHDLQGKCIGYKEVHDMPSGPAFDTDGPLTIGYGPGLDFPAHTGRIAHVRVYNGARSQAEIEQGIARDRLALVPFRKSHPIDFHLYDDDDQAVLYISDDPAGHNLHLELHNTSAQVIQLHNGHGAVASEANHHFAVRFRPGTLSDSTLKALVNPQERGKILQQTEQWEVYFPPTLPAANEAAALYLLYKGPAKTIQPDERRTLTLQRMSAAPGSGARGTQVELLPHQLTAAGGDATPITGSRTQYVHITNQRGHKNIPLHVWFEGGNTVVNDGVSSTPLTLCIGNASADRDITLDATSQFLISFDVGDGADAAWTMTPHESEVHVRYEQTELPSKLAGQGISRQWSLKFPLGKVLPKRGSAGTGPLKITIEGIRTSPQASGHANLYVQYDHIPGYQDGRFILTVEKSPLVYDKKGNVAIGKPIQKVDIPKVDVAGTVVADRLSVSRDNAHRGGLFFAGAGDFNHALYNNHSNLDGEGTWDGAKWNTFKGLNIRVGNRNDKPSTLRSALLIDATGHVGIRTPTPKSTLSVAGGLAVGATYAETNAAPANSLIVQGTLGIGTPQPQAKLEIAGEATGNTPLLIVRKGAANYLTISNDGNVGIGTTDPKAALQIGNFESEDTYLKVAAGRLHRAGIKFECGQHNEYFIEFESGGPFRPGLQFTKHRPDYPNVPRVDFFLDRETGNVGIGTPLPEKRLEVLAGELQVTARHNNPTADIGAFYDPRKARGIGIGYNQIASIGSDLSQDILMVPKGQGIVRIKGPLEVNGTFRVNGLPIFDYGKRMNQDEQKKYARMLKEPTYQPGTFILFVRDDKSDDICCLVKKSHNEVRLLSFYCSGNDNI